MYRPDDKKDELRRRRLRLGVLLFCAMSFVLLACRLEASHTDPTAPAPTRVARRPTFTPRPPDTDTPEATLTPVPSATPAPTEVPPTKAPTRRPTLRPLPTNPPPPPPTATSVPPTNTPVPTATVVYQYKTSGKDCEGDDGAAEDTVKGKITAANGNVTRGMAVRGSAGPGGEPISYPDAVSGGQGNYTVTFVCNNAACNGDFWVWLVDDGGKQLSPYIQFSFGGGCRRGVVNFQKRE